MWRAVRSTDASHLPAAMTCGTRLTASRSIWSVSVLMYVQPRAATVTSIAITAPNPVSRRVVMVEFWNMMVRIC